MALAFVLASCGSTATTSPPPTRTPGPGDPLPDVDAAIARAVSVADIGGPLVAEEVLHGAYAALDPEAHNFLGPAPAAWPGTTEVWRVTLVGPHGSETIVLSMTGDLIGAVTQGN
jgi:hypothetical protein